MTTGPKDDFLGVWFAVEFQGQISAGFRECNGLGSEHEVVEQRMNSMDGHPIIRKVPGNLKWTNVTLKRGITDTMDMWKWRKLVEEGKIQEARKNGSIVLYSLQGEEIARWDLLNAWPSKINGPSVNATSNEIAVEELELVHEGYERVK